MKTVWRLTLAMIIAMALTACQTKPTVEDTTPPPETETKPDVVITAAPDPRDYTDSRNLDNPESLLSTRVIYFDYDKSTVRSEFRGIVSAHAAYASSHSSARVTLEGHADERGTREYNLGLGERRATSARNYLIALNVDAGRIGTISYGKERPVCATSNEACWSQNRRDHMIVN